MSSSFHQLTTFLLLPGQLSQAFLLPLSNPSSTPSCFPLSSPLEPFPLLFSIPGLFSSWHLPHKGSSSPPGSSELEEAVAILSLQVCSLGMRPESATLGVLGQVGMVTINLFIPADDHISHRCCFKIQFPIFFFVFLLAHVDQPRILCFHTSLHFITLNVPYILYYYYIIINAPIHIVHQNDMQCPTVPDEVSWDSQFFIPEVAKLA